MKHLILLLSVLWISGMGYAQAPEKMSYQAVIRDAVNNLLVNTPVGMQISILQTSPGGTAVFVETHSPTTNANGLVSLEIGTGTPVTGTFAAIDWSAGPYFLKTETDPAGGTAYSITGTSELLSVPYALHARTAENVDDADADPNNEIELPSGGTDGQVLTLCGGVPTWTSGACPQIGDFHEGGVIFYLDGTGGGLVADIADLPDSEWGCHGNPISGADGTAIGTGAQNTLDIEAGCTTANTAADRCTHSTAQGYTDWFLPSQDELNEMYLNKATIDATALANGGSGFANDFYWGSSEFDSGDARGQNFLNGGLYVGGKFSLFHIRAVRAF